MRFALWFGIAAFLISGGLFNAVAHNAEGVLGLAFIVGVAAAIYGAHLQNQHEQSIDSPGGKVYFINKFTAFHRIKDVLVAHRTGGQFLQSDMWSFSLLDSEDGRINATLTFVEQMSPFAPNAQLPAQPRRLSLNVTLTNPSPGQTVVALHWLVSSPVNRDNCDAIIHDITSQIDNALTRSPSLVS